VRDAHGVLPCLRAVPMSRRSWVTSSLARRPEIFCWVFSGRTPCSLMLFVGPTDTYQREWDAALAALREAGWQAEMTCLAAPVQLEGVLPCGEQFYFRSRHDEILPAAGGEDPSGIAPRELRAGYGPPGGEEAFYLPAQPGLRLLQNLSAEHRPSCPHSGGAPAG
jgi:hypothetical protein